MTDKDDYTIEMMGLDHYSNWWEAPTTDTNYPNRWEEFLSAVHKRNTLTAARLVREAHVEAYKAGVLFKLTGE